MLTIKLTTYHKYIIAWLVKDNKNIGVISFQHYYNYLLISFIEIRKPYRGNNFSSWFIQELSNLYGMKIFTDGDYTSDGYHLLKNIPSITGYKQVMYSPTTFVYDWEKEIII